MSLCAPCQDFISKNMHWKVVLNTSEGHYHASSKARVVDERSPEIFLCSVDHGCYICTRLFRKLSEHLQSQIRGLKGPLPRNKRCGSCGEHPSERPGRSRDGPPVVFMDYGSLGNFFNAYFSFGYKFHPCAYFKGRLMNPTVEALSESSWRIASSSTGSEETLTKIDKWLGHCNSWHKKCLYHREKQEKGWYPTRLLHFSSLNGHEGQNLRLQIVHRTRVPAGSQYATLSHRWGSANVAKLTVENLSSWTQEIPTEILPRTFLDAVRAAKRLGINYLWIDCLCIIQEGDSLEDWKKEAPTMQDVYSNSSFNICASWGPEIGGLFATRDPSKVEPASFEMRSELGQKKVFLLVSTEEGDGTWEELVEHSPLASRGWVFQERLLTPRNIFFCKEIVLYECYQQRWSESIGKDVEHLDPDLQRESAAHDDIDSSPNIKTLLPTSSLTSGEDIYETWYDLVERYSGTKVTFTEDRLAAAAGIAQRFSKLLKNDVYVAGLWLSRLSLDMLWRNADVILDPGLHDASPRPTQLTFSWISGYRIVIEVKTGDWADEKFILPQIACVKWRTHEDMAAEDYLSSEDIFMLPSKPIIEIKVRGILKRMILRRGPQSFYASPVGAIAVSKLRQDLEALWALRERERDRLGSQRADVTVVLDFAASRTDISVLNDSGTLFYVPWYDNDRLSNAYCLLLELVCGKMGRFRRIGILNCGSNSRELYFASQVDEQDYPCWKYHPSTGEHTIFIV